MQWPRTGRRPTDSGLRPVPTVTTDTGREVQPSPGLKHALDAVASRAPIRIVDLGPALAGNLEFLQQVANRFHFLDLLHDMRSNGNLVVLERSVASQLDLLESVSGTVDLVLAWDVLNYLPQAEAAGVVATLADSCRPDAVLFARVVDGEMMPAIPNRYHIRDRETVLCEPRTTEGRGGPGLTPAAVQRLLEGFSIEHSFVLRSGFREFVARRGPGGGW